MNTIAPEIFRKRFLIEGFFNKSVSETIIRKFFQLITGELSLKTYSDPIVHTTGGIGKKENQGYDAFVPLIDSGIYLAVWSNHRFVSLIIYTCKDFNELTALEKTKEFFQMTETDHKLF